MAHRVTPNATVIQNQIQRNQESIHGSGFSPKQRDTLIQTLNILEALTTVIGDHHAATISRQEIIYSTQENIEARLLNLEDSISKLKPNLKPDSPGNPIQAVHQQADQSQLNSALNRMNSLLEKLELFLATTESSKTDNATQGQVPPPEWARNNEVAAKGSKREITIDPNQPLPKKKPTIPDYDLPVTVIDEDDWNNIHKRSYYFNADDAATISDDVNSEVPIGYLITNIEFAITDAAKTKKTHIDLTTQLNNAARNGEATKEETEKVIEHFTSPAIGFRVKYTQEIGRSFYKLSWDHLLKPATEETTNANQ